MTQPPTTQNAAADRHRGPLRARLFVATDLPGLMSDTDDPSPHRAPLLQFIWDWNVSDDKAAMVTEAPTYDGDDSLLLPALAAVVHALAMRDGVPPPDWVFDHRHNRDAHLFGMPFDSPYVKWLRRRSPDVCAYHRVWFHPRLLDKGTPQWWLPWD